MLTKNKLIKTFSILFEAFDLYQNDPLQNKNPKLNTKLQYHQFKADSGPLRFGNELDFEFSRHFNFGTILLLSLAEFRSSDKNIINNARKITLSFEHILN